MSGQNSLRARCLRVRRVLRWTQYDLAKATGIYRSKVSDFERGHIDLTDEERVRVEAALADGFGEKRRQLDHEEEKAFASAEVG